LAAGAALLIPGCPADRFPLNSVRYMGFAVSAVTGAFSAALIEPHPDGSGLGTLVSSSAPTIGLAVAALASR
jgi:hypothetical protein